jgi:poly(3-hydroxybutyrate) depolymerase
VRGHFVALLAAASVVGGCGAASPAPLELDAGVHVLEAAGRGWEGISRVWYFKPAGDQPLRVVMVIHGAGRNAEDYLDSWVELAEERRLLIVAPEFGEERAIRIGGEWEWRFNTGNVVSWFGLSVDRDEWYFESVERLFDSMRRAGGDVLDRYVLFGHSAGGQFVHRMVLFQPEVHFDLAIAANSGWYTLPDEDRDFPYGLSGAPHSGAQLDTALGRPLVVFLGTADTPDQGGFRTTPEAMDQGADRIRRGTHFYEAAQRFAAARGVDLRWTLEHAEGIGHDYRGMASAALRLLEEGSGR